MKLSDKNKALLRRAGMVLLNPLISFVCSSLIKKIVNRDPIDKLEREGKKYIVAFWHGKMLFGWYFFKKKGFAGLTSQSKDGDILASVLNKWGYSVVRGSSSKGGSEALNEIVQEIKLGHSIAITPDGPRGPVHQMKAGAAVAAKKAGVPLIFMGISYKRTTKMESWDSFEIPHPFSFVKVVFSDPIYIPSDWDRDKLSSKITEYEEEFNRVQSEAEKAFFK
jgi:lysophospholipid acyltransferase (LPLAT)-like uncharacterized protein